jgi:hypothetical protein
VAIGRIDCQIRHRLICNMDGVEIIFVAGIVSNYSRRPFADAFHISFCVALEAKEGSLSAKFPLK